MDNMNVGSRLMPAWSTAALDDRRVNHRAGCSSRWMTVALAKCVAASPGKQNKEPVQDCALLRCCLLRCCLLRCCSAWQVKQGARARLRSAALLLCLASAKRSPCKTALLLCCRAWQARKGARARLRSAALLLAALLPPLASKTRSPCKTAFCCFTIQSCLMTAALAKCVAASPGKQNKAPVQDCVLLRCCFA